MKVSALPLHLCSLIPASGPVLMALLRPVPHTDLANVHESRVWLPSGTPTVVPCSSLVCCPVMPSPDTAADLPEGTQTGRTLVRKSNTGEGSNLLFGRSLPQPPAGCPAEMARKLRMTQVRRQRGQMAPASRRSQGISETWMGYCHFDRLGSKTHPLHQVESEMSLQEACNFLQIVSNMLYF